MRSAALALCLLMIGFVRAAPRPPAAAPSFEAEIKPILQRCTPCHFPGGKMYDKLPFDRPATVVKLGERLFTRIEKEDERATIRRFLAAQRSAQ
ncbi:MAG TPA: hypothetical protein VI670_16065 [Thermoanaerobaculia bacterium]|jgi:hypothetical protein